MALDKSIIEDGLINLGEKAANGDTSSSWNDFCDIIGNYANGLTYPKPIGVSAGVASMKGILSSLNEKTGAQAPVLVELALLQLGIAIMSAYPLPVGPSSGMGSGVSPTIPPSTPLLLAPLFSNPNDLSVYASQMALKIDIWFRSGVVDVGLLQPGTPPVPVPVPSPWQ